MMGFSLLVGSWWNHSDGTKHSSTQTSHSLMPPPPHTLTPSPGLKAEQSVWSPIRFFSINLIAVVLQTKPTNHNAALHVHLQTTCNESHDLLLWVTWPVIMGHMSCYCGWHDQTHVCLIHSLESTAIREPLPEAEKPIFASGSQIPVIRIQHH